MRPVPENVVDAQHGNGPRNDANRDRRHSSVTPLGPKCTECGQPKAPSRWNICPACHAAYRDGLDRRRAAALRLPPIGVAS
jgi:hypothetical protein